MSEIFELKENIISAMETGNTGVARTLLGELQELAPQYAQEVQLSIVTIYGIYL